MNKVDDNGSSSQNVPKPVTISYNDLLERPYDLSRDLERALGSGAGCLGIVLISDLPPHFPALRENLFRLAHRFATLPDNVKESMARPETSYLYGWSHGKEVMNGKPDLQKGSFYANPLLDLPNVSEDLRRKHPEYYAGNIWPSSISGMEDFESTFKELGKVIYEVGLALAGACEKFVSSSVANPKGTIRSLIKQSQCNKARLLHYYPEPLSDDSTSSSTQVGEILQNDALCGTHLDHSLLTGLCSAMYLSQDNTNPEEEPKIVPPPSTNTGLWIYPRNSSTAVKVSIPPDCLAFQTGEALALLTSNKLSATPHFVSGSSGTSPSTSDVSVSVSRETFAFFLQPDVDDIVGPDSETFGQFTKRVLGRHYKLAQEAED